MSVLSALAPPLRRTVEAWRREMDVVSLEHGRPATAGVLQRLTGVSATAVHGIARGDDGIRFERPDASNIVPGTYEWTEAQWRDASRVATMFTPDRPEPQQRNRALFTGAVEGMRRADRSLFGFSNAEFRRRIDAFERDLVGWRRFGLASLHQLRILLCEGPTLVGFMMAMHERPMTEVHRSRFKLLVGPLRRRLRMEHLLRRRGGERVLLAAALEAFSHATYVVSRHGQVLHANQVGRAVYERGRRALREHLAAAARGQVGVGTRVTALASAGTSAMQLVEVPTRLTRRAVEQVRGLGFTRREREVLSALLAGGSHRMIAGALRISERTVEQHVRALLHKADADSVADLVVQLSARPEGAC